MLERSLFLCFNANALSVGRLELERLITIHNTWSNQIDYLMEDADELEDEELLNQISVIYETIKEFEEEIHKKENSAYVITSSYEKSIQILKAIQIEIREWMVYIISTIDSWINDAVMNEGRLNLEYVTIINMITDIAILGASTEEKVYITSFRRPCEFKIKANNQ